MGTDVLRGLVKGGVADDTRTPSDGKRVASDAEWRGATWRRAQEMRLRLEAVADASGAIAQQLDTAQQLANTRFSRFTCWSRWLRLMPQKDDALAEEAGRSLAIADARLLLVESPEAAVRRVVVVRGELDRTRVPSKVRQTEDKALQEFLTGKHDADGRHTASAALLHIGIAAATTQKHWADFNSRLFGVSLWMVGGVLALCGVTMGLPSFLPLCGPSGGGDWCAGNVPSRGGVTAVVVVGALGGLVSTVMALSRRPRTPVPDFVRATENGLRVPLGALVAVLGVLLLQSGIVSGAVSQFQPTRRPEAVLIWAAAFGFASILFAKLVDRKLTSVAEELDNPPHTPAATKRTSETGGDPAGG